MKTKFTWARPAFLTYPTQLCMAAIPVQICGFIGRAYGYDVAAAKILLLGYTLTAAGVLWATFDLFFYVRRTRRELVVLEQEFNARVAKFEASKAAMIKELDRFERSLEAKDDAPLDQIEKPAQPKE